MDASDHDKESSDHGQLPPQQRTDPSPSRSSSYGATSQHETTLHQPKEDASTKYDVHPDNPASPTSSTSSGTAHREGRTHTGYGYKVTARPTFVDRLSAITMTGASPINMLANKMGSEGFLPTTMDKECEKAARIIRGFCASDAGSVKSQGQGHGKSRAVITIPSSVIQHAVGLAIFTTGRIGFQVSGATGSGVLVTRMADGRWSPPSGLQIHSVGAGFMIGADIYDCVLVLNTAEAVNAFRRARISLGSDVIVVAGPWGGAGGSVDAAGPTTSGKSSEANYRYTEQDNSSSASLGSKGTRLGMAGPRLGRKGLPSQSPSPFRQVPPKAVYSYIKSRGVYAGVQVDGTVVTTRHTANSNFYRAQLGVDQILRGAVPRGSWLTYSNILCEAIVAAETWDAPPQSLPSDGPSSQSVHEVSASETMVHEAPASESMVHEAPASESMVHEAPADTVLPAGFRRPDMADVTGMSETTGTLVSMDSVRTVSSPFAVSPLSPASTGFQTVHAVGQGQTTAVEASSQPIYEAPSPDAVRAQPAELEAEVYVEQPPPYEENDQAHAGIGDNKTEKQDASALS